MIDLAGFTTIVRPFFLLSQNEAICDTFFVGIIKYTSPEKKSDCGQNSFKITF